MIADITVTPSQVGIGLGVFVVMGGAILMFRKVFDYATRADLQKLDTTIGLELARHSVARHEMRHEVQKLTASMIRVETILEQLPSKLNHGTSQGAIWGTKKKSDHD